MQIDDMLRVVQTGLEWLDSPTPEAQTAHQQALESCRRHTRDVYNDLNECARMAMMLQRYDLERHVEEHIANVYPLHARHIPQHFTSHSRAPHSSSPQRGGGDAA